MKLCYKPEKYEFNKTEVKFLGYVINLGGILIDLGKVAIVMD